eukprot:gene4070-5095_t
MVSDNPLEKVKETSLWIDQHSKYVKINRSKIHEFLNTLTKEEFISKSQVVLFPLNFSNHVQEINFWFILDLINFGSGYRKELHKFSNRGAYETICYGLFGMFLSQSGNLSADYLNSLSLNEVSSFFSIPVSEEVEIQPGIYSYKDSPVKSLVQKIQTVLKESAQKMISLGFPDFGSFVWSFTDPSKLSPGSNGPLASNFVEKLVKTIPAFADEAVYEGHKIYIYKKVQLLAADLHRRFKDTLPDRFNFTDLDNIAVFTDNVLPAVLRKFGILELSKDLEEQIDAGIDLAGGSEKEIELRVQAIQACYEIVSAAKIDLTSKPDGNFITNCLELDYYLWTKGKDPNFRIVERHYTKQTIFY